MNSESFFKSFFKIPFDDVDFVVTYFLRFLTKPNRQNSMQAEMAAARHPRAAYSPPGISRRRSAGPHSSSVSSKPDGQFGRPVK